MVKVYLVFLTSHFPWLTMNFRSTTPCPWPSIMVRLTSPSFSREATRPLEICPFSCVTRRPHDYESAPDLSSKILSFFLLRVRSCMVLDWLNSVSLWPEVHIQRFPGLWINTHNSGVRGTSPIRRESLVQIQQ